ncbi:MAG: branched-chain amino acid ABC transporter permease, partial [Chloroflexota bacterium]|nr:branched-chain amino acid ABC transporter permease [Chloroflexota bacterium]
SILTGYCGQISIGHAAFVAIGAYTSAILATDLGFPFWIALPCSGIVAGLIGIVFGLPSLRVKGFYLVMATLAAQFIVHFILMLNPYELTGGSFGLTAPAPKIGGLVFNSAHSFYYIALGTCILATFLAKNLARMDVGRAFIAIRDNDIAAEVMGINLYRSKLLAFFLGCFFAGIAGSLFVHYMGTVSPDRFTLLQSIWFLGMLIIGGMGSTVGVVFGVTFVQVLEELTVILSTSLGQAFPMMAMQAAAFAQIIFGLVVVLFLVFEPRGLAHRWQLLKASYRLWPFSY